MIPTGLTFLGVGIQALASTGQAALGYIVATLTTIGSLVLTGNIYLLTELNATPAIFLNTQAAVTLQADGDIQLGSGDLLFDQTRNGQANGAMCTRTVGGNFISCYQEDTFTATGASGIGPSYYRVASITNPYTGTGVIKSFMVSCDGQGVASQVTTTGITLDSAPNSSCGTIIAFRRATTSGAIVTTSTGSYTWPRNRDVSVYASLPFTASNECLLGVWSTSTYMP